MYCDGPAALLAHDSDTELSSDGSIISSSEDRDVGRSTAMTKVCDALVDKLVWINFRFDDIYPEPEMCGQRKVRSAVRPQILLTDPRRNPPKF